MPDIIQFPSDAKRGIKISLRQQIRHADQKISDLEKEKTWLADRLAYQQVMILALATKFHLSKENVEDFTADYIEKRDKELAQKAEEAKGVIKELVVDGVKQ